MPEVLFKKMLLFRLVFMSFAILIIQASAGAECNHVSPEYGLSDDSCQIQEHGYIGREARFFAPEGITSDGINLYVADTNNNTIRKVVIASSAVTTLAGSAANWGATDSTGKAASFSIPRGITTDGKNLFVADTNNNTIRKVVIATGVVTTLAGRVGVRGATDGMGNAARFNNPEAIVADGTNLFVADSLNHTIRKVVIATGMVTTLAGNPMKSGAADGAGVTALFSIPRGIATDGTNLFVADSLNHTIRKVVIATGIVSTLAGSSEGWGDSDGTGREARFYSPHGIVTDGTNLFVADTNNHVIRKVVIKTGVVTTIAGSAGCFGTSDGSRESARFFAPHGVTTNGKYLFVTDTGSDTIRRVTIATGAVTTLAGTPLRVIFVPVPTAGSK
jgi:sugar lactone lactonase YvrE